MWAWHQAVLQGEPTARKTCSLQLFSASPVPEVGPADHHLCPGDAWPSEARDQRVEAGATEVVTETVVLLCDQILMQPAG